MCEPITLFSRETFGQRFNLYLCLAFILFLALLSAARAEDTRVVVAYSSINPNSSHLEIARAQGFYRNYGLDPEIILVRSSATATAGLAAGKWSRPDCRPGARELIFSPT
jgi:ABC-type nitrate/sulfonate/bicarbonate transport system substrate-binding protein